MVLDERGVSIEEKGGDWMRKQLAEFDDFMNEKV